ncbi:MAG: hypothetical protein WAZ77_09320 [Candidatus Nitrosopolaris sp.]
MDNRPDLKTFAASKFKGSPQTCNPDLSPHFCISEDLGDSE